MTTKQNNDHGELYQDLFVQTTVLTDTVFIVLGGIGFGNTEEIDLELSPTVKMHITTIKGGGLMTALSHITSVPRDIRTFKQAFNKNRRSKLDTLITDDEDVKKVYKLIVTYTRTPEVKNIILIGISLGAVKIALTLLKVLEDHKRGLDKIVFFAISSPFVINKGLLPMTMDKKDISITLNDIRTVTDFRNTAPLPSTKPYSYATWLVSKYNSRVINFYHVKDPYMAKWLPAAATVTNIRIPTLKKYEEQLTDKKEFYDVDKAIFIIKKEKLDPYLPEDFKQDVYLYHSNVFILYKVLSSEYFYIIRYITKDTPTSYRFIQKPKVKTTDVLIRSAEKKLDFWKYVLKPPPQ